MVFIVLMVAAVVSLVLCTVSAIVLAFSVRGYWLTLSLAALAAVLWISNDPGYYGPVHHAGIALGWLGGAAAGGMVGALVRAGTQRRRLKQPNP